MDWLLWLRALLLMIMIEGLVLFVTPAAYKDMVRMVSRLETATMRKFGLAMMIVALLLALLVT